MTEALVFRRVRALNPAGALDAVVDVVVERGRITRLGRDAADDWSALARPGARCRAARGLALAGAHRHPRAPARAGREGKEDVASGLLAAAAGGFVDVCCMPNTRPVNDSRVVTEMLVAKGRAHGGARLHPIGAITMGQAGEQLSEMADMRAAAPSR